MPSEINNLSKLCIHTITTKPLSFLHACEKYSKLGVRGITIWEDAIERIKAIEVNKIVTDNNLEVVSYCRGGFFPSIHTSERTKAIEKNKSMIETCALINAPIMVLVCGADPRQSIDISRVQIFKAIEELVPFAESMNVKLAIEPLHPMYADTRSAINSLHQANDLVESINSSYLGVAVDVYHLWWEPDLDKEIDRCGKNKNIFAFHICDWKVPTTDLLLDRGIMGEGCINIKQIRGWVEEGGFIGFNEVEIFSKEYWKEDQDEYLKKIINGYLNHS